jgi:hypothetical protein
MTHDEAAKAVGVSGATLRSYHLRYAEMLPAELAMAHVPEVISRVEVEVFGWLLDASEDRGPPARKRA